MDVASVAGQPRPRCLVSVYVVMLVAVIAAVPYWNTLHGGIVYDDKVAVLGNPDVTNHDIPLPELFLHDFWGNRMKITLPEWLGVNVTLLDSPWTHNSYRPLTVLTIRFNNWLAGYDTPVYHVTNIVLHALTAICALYVLATLLGRARRLQAAVAAVLFAAHPVHSEVVANITSRAETLCGVFALAAVGVYFHMVNPRVRTSRPGALASVLAVLASFTLVLVAVLCKETALVIPALIAAVDMACVTPDDPQFVASADQARGAGAGNVCGNFVRYLRHVVLRGSWPRALCLLALQVLLLYVRVAILSSGYTLHTSSMHNPIQSVEDAVYRRLSYAYVQSLAMSMLVLPLFLSHEHNALQPIASLADPRVWVVVAVCVAVAGLFAAAFSATTGSDSVTDAAAVGEQQPAPAHAANRRARIVAGVLLTFIPFVPASHMFVSVAFVLAERSLFLPSLGAALLMSEVLLWACSRLYPSFPVPVSSHVADAAGPASPALHSARSRAVEASVVVEPMLVAGGVVLPHPTLRRRPVERLSADGAAPSTAGTSSRGVGTATSDADSACDLDEEDEFSSAALAPARRKRVLLWLVACICGCYMYRTVVRNRAWLSEEALLTSNLELYPDHNPMSTYGLGARAMYDGDLDKAVDYLLRSLVAASPTMMFAEPYILLAQIYWGHEYGHDGQHMERAKEYLRKGVIDNNSAKREYWSNLGLLMFATERHDPVALNQSEYYVLAASIGHALGPNDPMLGMLYLNAGCIRLLSESTRFGNPALAEQEFLKAADSRSPHAVRSAHGNLATLYAIHGLFDLAVESLQKAIETTMTHRDASWKLDIDRFQDFARTLSQNEELIRSWVDLDMLVVGELAQARMGMLSSNCKTILLWL